MIKFYRHKKHGDIIAVNDALIGTGHAQGQFHALIGTRMVDATWGAWMHVISKFVPLDYVRRECYEVSPELARGHNERVWALALLRWRDESGNAAKTA